MIKNIIFDFGDIFINLDKTATALELSKFGFTEITPELDTLMKSYEKGLISSDDFIADTNKIFTTATPEQLKIAWNKIILDFPEERLTFIETLAKETNYRLFLLSNTNKLHIEQVIKNMNIDRYNRFKNCFEQFYLSHLINFRKPDAAIYEFVLKENNLKAKESFFIDDTKENTIAAEKLGIKSWNLQVGKEDIINLKSKL
ncbi:MULTISPECIES: HAD-IA family hydrolase [unclassified Cellulophaga]|uniref:HAD-IA family hydrolase n=1 Tax=unclassified Cellulophaga TaxID=2634405 RepID=UPI0026E48D4A|nr:MULTISPECIES: HAD-IA family hydrolase [unclassified Cellulophaga]MDO6490807.1 HAD-IA family hydrolase [Cellulophaga sp. 2_MG-2023]MDO6493999.1 HAD-IA family hydrolase [Cellulophaga sp. 3_MG-2023]